MRRVVMLTALSLGCAVEPSSPAPVIDAVSVGANPTNVLAATVAVRLRNADSVRVRYHISGGAMDGTTPAFPASPAIGIPVLGLLPEQGYVLRVEAFGAGGAASSDSLEFLTQALPGDLPSYTTGGFDPSPGFVVFAAGKYGLVIDNTGRVVWYHRFDPVGPGLAFLATPNGRYVARPPEATPGGTPLWTEVDPSGSVTRRFGCAGGLVPRFHDLIREPDDSYWVMCDDTRTMDLSALGGVAGAQVMGTEIQHLQADGMPIFRWSPFDHFDIADLDPSERAGQVVNWTHGNALALDRDGNLLVSFRSLSEITSIDPRTGAVRWRLGGRQNEFGGSGPVFVRQHGLRVATGGQLLLLDNAGIPGNSRVERYAIDEARREVRMEATFSALPPVVASLGGSVQQLPGSRLLLAFGNGNRVEEVDGSGVVRWRIEGNPGYVFRAQRILSLYRPGVGTPR